MLTKRHVVEAFGGIKGLRRLLGSFLEEAAPLLSSDGCIEVTLCAGQGGTAVDSAALSKRDEEYYKQHYNIFFFYLYKYIYNIYLVLLDHCKDLQKRSLKEVLDGLCAEANVAGPAPGGSLFWRRGPCWPWRVGDPSLLSSPFGFQQHFLYNKQMNEYI